MLELAIDIETFSTTDISRGVHKYVEDNSFEILLFAYQIDSEQIKIVDLASGEKIPSNVMTALWNPNVLKIAYNAAFEITCLNAHFTKLLGKNNTLLDASQWSCTMALAAQAGYPFGLDMVAKIMKLQTQKDSAGKALIKYFCMPCKATKSNGGRIRNTPNDMDKWIQFKKYCVTDVAVEQEIRNNVLKWFKVPSFENRLWALDQKINNRGVCIDKNLVNNAIAINDIETNKLIAYMQKLTGIENPNSDTQIKSFILAKTGITVKSLNKEFIGSLYKQFEGTDVIEVLDIRQKLSRTSIKKFEAMQASACSNNRISGLFQYYGANRTGRWAGRNVQLQNLVRNSLSDLDFARTLVKNGNFDALLLSYNDIGKVLSNLIRSAFIPSPGNVLIVSDFSAIEARVIAWLANEQWRMNVFAGHGKIYEASASMMFNIPIENITKDLRQKGKVAELALGYQGGVGALIKMGGEAMGLTEPEMDKIKIAWRKASPNIVRLWDNCNKAAIDVTTGGRPRMVNNLCKFHMKNGNMLIQLPSGRNLVYIDAFFNGKGVSYYGMDQVKKTWCKHDTYGGKIVENIVQAIARDLLAYNLVKLDDKGYDITMHVHDEVVIEEQIEKAQESANDLNNTLSQEVPWAKGLILGAETFITNYYTK